MSKKKDLVKNTFIILLGKLCTQFISFLLLPLYTNYLLTEEFGYVDLINTYVSLLVPIFTLQLEMAIFRFLIDARNNNEEKEKYITTNIITLIFVIISIMLLFAIVMIFVNIKYGAIIALIIVLNMLSGDLLQIARGLGKNIIYSIASVISGVSTIVLNITFIIYFKMGTIGMLSSIAIANGLSVIYLLFSLKINRYFKINKYSSAANKKMLKYSVPLIPNGISWWIMSASDRSIVSFILGVSANGIYAVSCKFPSILSGIFNVFNLSWSESISLHIKEDDNSDYISSVFDDVLKIFGCIGIIIISFISLTFSYLINNNYNEAYLYIPILIVASIFSLLAAQYGGIYIALKKTKQISYTTIIAAIINLFVNIALIKFIGLYAAAISTLVSYMVISIYRHLDIKKTINIIYNVKTVLIIIISYILIISFYYLNIFYLNILSFIISILISIFINRIIIKKIYKSIIIKLQKTKKNEI